jgi:hypothetical protein
MLAVPAAAQTRPTSPKEYFGFNIGDDYQLANYTQYEAYLKKLDQESDRLKVVEMGKSAEGRTMYLGIITSPGIDPAGRRRQLASAGLWHARPGRCLFRQ